MHYSFSRQFGTYPKNNITSSALHELCVIDISEICYMQSISDIVDSDYSNILIFYRDFK